MRNRLALVLAVLLAAVAAAVCAEGELPNGVYAPDEFRFTGGTGRVVIDCPQVAVADGQATARIVFGSPNYTTLTYDGVQYTAAHEGDASVFEIPAELNRSFEITAVTTAMSRPHGIGYTLYIQLNAARHEKDLAGLTWESELPLSYAECFSVDFYSGGYALIDVKDGARYLAVPENQPVPEGLDPGITVLPQPLDRVYLAATPVMSLIDRLDAMDAVRFSGTQAEGWTVENASEAMRAGSMLFAGKYSEPDYELLLREECDLAVESTMILHTPKVQELLEMLGIPVFVDRSSYEPHPLGRTEWIKVYGVLFGRQAEACAFFEEQCAILDSIGDFPQTDRMVAFFYISADGSVVVRGASDYVADMIALGGGRYAFSDMTDEDSTRASVSITMEDFYAAASDADYLIYNTSIDTTVSGLADLIARSGLLSQFKAVREGNVWCAGSDLFQAADTSAGMISDIHKMLCGEEEGMVFLKKLC
ncbi:MAG: ABC transporter substrate-binding protein [Clostridia bacterium]|nr:ABC transporter substrate-binding protein [Clostridia bacterium]